MERTATPAHRLRRVLLVEDEPHIRYSLRFNLETEGYEVVEAANGVEALQQYKDHCPFVAIILDVQLPEMDGFEVARRIRQSDERTQILMLTARAADEDRVTGFKAGVDDYITKPFHLQELLLRISRMTERAQIIASNEDGEPYTELKKFALRDLVLHYDSLILEYKGKSTHLTALEADCLSEFLKKPSTVLTREFLLKNVWKIEAYQETRTVDNCIMRLRKHLEEIAAKDFELESVRGRGYQMTIPENQ